MSRVFALSDGNSFYCSCERVFDPALHGRPVIVLSNNDGCAIARTPEAKALGVKMGAPWHLIRESFTAAGGVARSSNYALYGDMSRRVNQVYRQFSPEVEVYSIDESFLDFTQEPDPAATARRMRRQVLQWTGIPTCVGLGPTKTLAKLANWAAKRLPELEGVCDFTRAADRNRAMETIAVEEVWGVAGASARKLAGAGVTTAAQLRDIDPRQARALLTVVGERLVWELRGVACLPLELEPPARQGIAVTRCFGRLVTTLDEGLEAIRTYAARAGEKLRQHGVATTHMYVALETAEHRPELPQRHDGTTVRFVEPTQDTLILLGGASAGMRRIWRDGYSYYRAGVIMDDLVAAEAAPKAWVVEHDRERRARLMETLDGLNARFGRRTIFPAGAGVKQGWTLRANLKSRHFTSRLDELPIAGSGPAATGAVAGP